MILASIRDLLAPLLGRIDTRARGPFLRAGSRWRLSADTGMTQLARREAR
jgi:hypothetical protein